MIHNYQERHFTLCTFSYSTSLMSWHAYVLLIEGWHHGELCHNRSSVRIGRRIYFIVCLRSIFKAFGEGTICEEQRVLDRRKHRMSLLRIQYDFAFSCVCYRVLTVWMYWVRWVYFVVCVRSILKSFGQGTICEEQRTVCLILGLVVKQTKNLLCIACI